MFKTAWAASVLFLSLIALQVEAGETFPRLFFHYSWLFDSECAEGSGYRIDPAWEREARERTPEFMALWERDGHPLLQAVIKRFGRGFARRELTATLSVCNTTSFSNPLVLNVRRFLKSFMGAHSLPPAHAFVDLVFHELLHTWLSNNLKWPTPLAKKYKGEDRLTRTHIHLIALQRFVYSSLGKSDELKWVGAHYGRLSAGYRRAWDIVDRIEGHDIFLKEIEENLTTN